jgi:hypothetical protein
LAQRNTGASYVLVRCIPSPTICLFLPLTARRIRRDPRNHDYDGQPHTDFVVHIEYRDAQGHKRYAQLQLAAADLLSLRPAPAVRSDILEENSEVVDAEMDAEMLMEHNIEPWDDASASRVAMPTPEVVAAPPWLRPQESQVGIR